MGILANALSILLGTVWGSWLKKAEQTERHLTLGIGIMILSLVGFLENIYYVKGNLILSKNLILVILAYILGSRTGERLHLEKRLSDLGKSSDATVRTLLDTTMFFGVGGLQISGPIAMAVHNDSSQLMIKSAIDFPFAVAFGTAYGKIAALSAFPVALIQLLIAGIAFFCSSLFTEEMIAQICAMGYIILFFSGYNLISDRCSRIHNINMIPGIFLILIFNMILNLLECLL